MKEETKKRWGVFAAPILAAIVALGMLGGGLVIAGGSALLALLHFNDMVSVFGMLTGTILTGFGGLAFVGLLRGLPSLLKKELA